ncbi:hypothetical protein IGI37_000256 [Enterococcus sp. AZ194]|uniref:ABC transporter permease n=1 Tax=Enterococcus sp. AZ194 TaxID=2774629 RepID=UPI003F297D24
MTNSFSISRVLSVIKLHILEQLRSYQLLITNIVLPVLFFGVSYFLKSNSDLNDTELSALINSQFFSTALMFGVITYAFTFPLINLVNSKEEQTLRWIKQTDLNTKEFTVGNKLANLLFLNLHCLFVILLFSLLGYLNLDIILKIIVLVNITFFVLNPFSFIISTFIKSTTFASNFSNLVMLFMVFTLTFSSLFSMQTDFSLDTIQKFLIINPLFGYYDSMLVLVGNANDYFFNGFIETILYVLVFGIVTSLIEWKTFRYE